MKDIYDANQSDAINRAIEQAHAGLLDRRNFMQRLLAFGFTTSAAALLVEQARAAAENQNLRAAEGSTNFDYIIVGAGSAGCVLASRLVANGTSKVLLIEAGGRNIDQDKLVVPAMWPTNWGTDTDYNYKTVPQKRLGDREVAFYRGKILGGSSSINALFWQRSDPFDYVSWETAGGSRWSQKALLQSFRELETFHGPANPYRGNSGRIPARQLGVRHPLAKLYLEAGQELGIKQNPDFNGERIEGVGYYDLNIDNGRRVSAAHAFVLPTLQASNFTLMTDVKVLKLVMHGKTCQGVQVRHGGEIKNLTASEIILSAGAVNSPELLLRSGIGDADDLKALGIPSVIGLPGVGRNLQDHVGCQSIAFSTKGKAPPPSGNLSEAHAFWKSDKSLNMPDVQLIFGQVPLGQVDIPADEGYAVLPALVRPDSVGSIKLKNADPDSSPLIDPNYLAEESDFKRLLLAVEMARDLGNAKAFADVRKAEASPGKLNPQQMRDFVTRNAGSLWHPVGTCRLGNGPQDVVDNECRVHGATGLRVVDASIMPRITTANTNAPTMMIAQKAADIILKSESATAGAAAK